MAPIQWHSVELDFHSMDETMSFTYQGERYTLNEFTRTSSTVWGDETLYAAGIHGILADSMGTAVVIHVDQDELDMDDIIYVTRVTGDELSALTAD